MIAPIMRLAFREEGEWVNCYFAKTGTMDGAILLATMKRKVLTVERWAEYKKMMENALAELLAAEGALVESFAEQPAPEHERSGRA